MAEQTSRQPFRVAMVAAEPSADRLGAGLIRAIRARHPRSEFIGAGGPEMAAAGCELFFAMERIGMMGLDGLLRKLPDMIRIRHALARRFHTAAADVFVGVDAPDFNLGLAAKLKRRGLPCAHYVSPTVWAWRGYRMRKIRRAVDHMLVLFPFEMKYYQRRRVPVTCVGHPLADEIDAADATAARAQLQLEGAPLIALLPGSRRGEVARLAAILVDAARRMHTLKPRARFIVPLANAAAAAEFAKRAGDIRDLPLRVVDGNARLALAACDAAVVASGTAALEAALLRRAMVVVYKLPPLSYWLLRRLRHVDYYSMPNQLLPQPQVPELIQRQATADNIAKQTLAMLDDPARMKKLTRQFAAIHNDLKRDAAARAAEAVLRVGGIKLQVAAHG